MSSSEKHKYYVLVTFYHVLQLFTSKFHLHLKYNLGTV